MSTIREEYNRDKERKKKAISEAAVGWVKSNVILLNEKINRRDIERLVSAIDKFQQTFGPYSSKLPTIQQSIEDVESGLEKIITGKKSGAKSAEMLKYMSFLYNNLSNFFKNDIPTLTKTRIFKLAVENPEVPMMDLASAKEMAAAFRTALKPDNDEAKLLKAIYKNSSLPELDVNKIAEELIKLSLSELRNLENVEKVPLVATEPAAGQEVQQVAETAPEPTQNIQESSLDQKKNLINEAVSLENIERMAKSIQQMNTALSGKGLKNVENALSGLAKQGQTAIANLASGQGGIQGAMSQILSNPKDTWNIAKKFNITKDVTILKQMEMAAKTADKIKSMTPTIMKLFENKPQLEKDDIENIRKILSGQLKGGFFNQMVSMAGTKPYQGLDADSIVNDFVSLLEQDPTGAKFKDAITSVSKVPVTQADTQGAADKAATANPASQTKTATQAAQAQPSMAGQPSREGSGAPVVKGGATPVGPAEDEVVKQLSKVIGGSEEQNRIALQKLRASGWQINPPRE